MKLSLNAKYQMANIFYFAVIASMLAFCSNYLLSLGYSNATIGLVMSIYSIICVFGQPALADVAERHPEIPIQSFIAWALLLIIGISLLLYFAGLLFGQNLLVLILIVMAFTAMNVIMPMFNTLAFVYEKFGVNINYGIARGLGSAAYAVVSMSLGYVISWTGENILPLFYALFAFLCLIVVRSYRLKGHSHEKREQHAKAAQEDKISFLGFVRKYLRFILFLFGFMLVYADHMLINNFYIQVITNAGGTASDMGIAIFIAAMMELPAMFGFNWLNKKFGTVRLLRISLLFFIVKHALTLIAVSIWLIYLAAFLQALAYAIYIPAAVYYTNEIVSEKDQLMGQSVNVMFMTLGGVVASLVGGVLLDSVGVHMALFIGLVLTVIGAAIAYVTIQKPKKKPA